VNLLQLIINKKNEGRILRGFAIFQKSLENNQKAGLF